MHQRLQTLRISVKTNFGYALLAQAYKDEGYTTSMGPLVFRAEGVHSPVCSLDGLFSVGVGSGLVFEPAGPELVEGLALAD